MGKRIAIIDDDHVIQESLQELFTDAGYTVFVASDGVSGYELIVREKPDIVVAEEFKGIPIILMTGVYKDVNLRMYVHKGLAEDFIEKPFREKDLLVKIEHFIGGVEKPLAQPVIQAAPDPGRDPKRQDGRSLERDLDDLVTWAHSKVKK
jgi:two-component system response regulator VanR